MAKSRLHELTEHGQSVWIDNLSRSGLEEGELARLMEEDAVIGVTSNPTIFQKAIASGDAYDEQLRELLKTEDDPKEIFLQLAAQDIADACDLLRPVWERTGASTASSPGRSIRPSPTTARARSRRPCACTSGSTARTCS